MFLWRHFSNIIVIASRKNSEKVKSQIKVLNEQCLYRLTQLIIKFDFVFVKLKKLMTQNSNIKMITTFLQQIRLIKYFFLSIEMSFRSAAQICEILRKISLEKVYKMKNNALILKNESSSKHRCERSFEGSHMIIKSWFFAFNIYHNKMSGLTHFAINCDIFRAFFDFDLSIDLSSVRNDSALMSLKKFDFFQFYRFSRIVKFGKSHAKHLFIVKNKNKDSIIRRSDEFMNVNFLQSNLNRNENVIDVVLKQQSQMLASITEINENLNIEKLNVFFETAANISSKIESLSKLNVQQLSSVQKSFSS